MKISATQILALGAVALAGFVITRTSSAVSGALDAINPINNDNIFANGFDELITAGTADEGFSLGSFIFDLLNPEFDPNATPPPVSKPRPFRGPI